MKPHLNIAIDGPAGAGKSTVAKRIARELGILYLDTGAMYRAMALKAAQNGVNCLNRESVLDLLEKTTIFAENIDGVQHTYLDGEDVSSLIRTADMAKGASDISSIPEVRIKLAQVQRDIAMASDVVMDGREIGSYVLPECRHKFFVTATVDERARRRLLELREKGQCMDMDVEEMARAISLRDHNDSTRKFAPLKRMPDAILIDTTDLSVEQAVKAILRYIKQDGGEA